MKQNLYVRVYVSAHTVCTWARTWFAGWFWWSRHTAGRSWAPCLWPVEVAPCWWRVHSALSTPQYSSPCLHSGLLHAWEVKQEFKGEMSNSTCLFIKITLGGVLRSVCLFYGLCSKVDADMRNSAGKNKTRRKPPFSFKIWYLQCNYTQLRSPCFTCCPHQIFKIYKQHCRLQWPTVTRDTHEPISSECICPVLAE